MKHLLLALLFSVLLFGVCNRLSYAQEPTAEPTPVVATDPEHPTVPPDSEDVVNGVTAIIMTAAGLLSSVIINLIKGIPGLSEGDKSKLSGVVLEVMSVIVGVVTGYVVGLMAQGLGLIGDSSLQVMIISLASPIISEIRYRLAQLANSSVVVVDEVHTT
jgi:hypothetical protein